MPVWDWSSAGGWVVFNPSFRPNLPFLNSLKTTGQHSCALTLAH